MLVLATDWGQVAPAVTAVGAAAAAVATGGALSIASRSFRRSTDKAEDRYRKELVIAYGPDLALPESDDFDEYHGTHQYQGAEKAQPEDSARQRMAALPVDYHAQVLAQSRQSFLFSIGAAVIGFVVIVASVLLVLGGLVTPGVVGMVGATLTEAVAALFFQISNKARSTMTGQLEGFRAAEELERQAHERRELIQMVEDPEVRDELLTRTVLTLAEVNGRPQLPTSSPGDAAQSQQS